MKSLFKSTYENKDEIYKIDSRYINYFMTNLLFSNNGLKFDEVYEYCTKEFECSISHTYLNEYLNTNFNVVNGNYVLYDKQIINFNEFLRVQHLFYYFQNKGIEYIKNEVEIMLSQYSKDINVLLSLILALNNITNNRPDDYYFMIAYDVILNFDNYYRDVDDIISNSLFIENINIQYLIKSNALIELLNNLGVYLISDLSNISTESFIAIFSINIKRVIGYLNGNSDFDVIDSLKMTIDKCFNIKITDQKNLNILFERYGILEKYSTLEEVGHKFGITRERVRQICEKCYNKINSNFINCCEDISFYFYILLGLDKMFITKEELLNKFGTSLYVNKLCFMCSEFESSICFDTKYNIFYNIDEYTIEDIISLEIEKIGKAISIDNYKKLNHFEQNIVLNDYRITNTDKELYILKKYSYPELVVDIIENEFLDGFKLGSEKSFELIDKAFQRKYNRSVKMTPRAIDSDLMRYKDFCYIDRGTIKKRDKCPNLPDDILNDIINFLSKYDGIVFYQTIFDEFKFELNSIGVNNRYFLKGILDEKLPNDFKTSRDYINVSQNNNTPYSEIYNFVINQRNIIKVEDLRKRYKGIKDYVFFNYISKIDNVIWIKYMEEFILLKNINISSSTLSTIVSNLNNLFDSLNSDVIVCSKLYSRLRLINPEIFVELEYFNNQFAFYSLISNLLKDKFYFRRPYISRDENKDLTHAALISNYVNGLPKFSSAIIKDYVTKMHLRDLESYLDFQIEMSDKFVQINMDTSYKKEILVIKESFIENFKNEINYYLNSFGFIDTRTYTDYSSLPRFRVGWNKYLLVGIIRSYLNDLYNLEYTDAMYNKTDFIIRRA